MGITIEDASKNAAVNALTNVVGTLIDSETLISKQTQISKGIVEKTKSISTDIKSYSQGSIAYFEILNVEEVYDVYRVTARVEVRVQDFVAFIKEYALGEQSIEVGLFVGMATELDGLEAKYSFFEKNIMDPIASGQAYNIEISEVVRFENSEFRDALLPKLNNFGINEREAVAFMMRLSLKEDFKANLEKVLENISDSQKKLRRSGLYFHEGYCGTDCGLFGFPSSEKGKHIQIAYFQKGKPKVNAYLLKNLRDFQSYKGGDRNLYNAPYNPVRYAWLRDMNDSNSMGKKDTLADLEINFVTGNGQLIESYYLPADTSYNGENQFIGKRGEYLWGTSVKYSENLKVSKRSPRAMKKVTPWVGHLLGRPHGTYRETRLLLFDELTFLVLLKVPVDVLREIGIKGKMEVRYLEDSQLSQRDRR